MYYVVQVLSTVTYQYTVLVFSSSISYSYGKLRVAVGYYCSTVWQYSEYWYAFRRTGALANTPTYRVLCLCFVGYGPAGLRNTANRVESELMRIESHI